MGFRILEVLYVWFPRMARSSDRSVRRQGALQSAAFCLTVFCDFPCSLNVNTHFPYAFTARLLLYITPTFNIIFPTVHIYPHSAHLSAQCIFVPTVHICPHSTHLSPQCTFIPTVHIYPHSAYLSPQCTFILTVHIYPHSAYLSPQFTFFPTVHIYPHSAR
jgi:hypothetical protein